MNTQLNKLDETKKHYFVSSDCPTAPGEEEVEVWFDIKKTKSIGSNLNNIKIVYGPINSDIRPRLIK